MSVNFYGGAYGAHPYHYAYDPGHYYQSSFSPWYSQGWYSGYSPYAVSPWYVHYGQPAFGVGYASSHWRFSLGFGYACSPVYYPRYWYPIYRTYAYYPFTYYSTMSYYPVYSTVYHTETVTVSYVDAADPYVEYTDDVPGGAPSSGPAWSVPEAFLVPLVDGFAEGLSISETIARGEEWMRNGHYLFAAEAFRRGWIANPDDDFAPNRLGIALFALGDRYSLAALALTSSLDRNPERVLERTDLRTSFPSPAAYFGAINTLERHLIRTPNDGEARFVLGYVHFASGSDFAAHGELTRLRDDGWSSAALDALIAEAERRLLAPREPGK